MSWSVDPMHTQVEFSAKHMGIMTVRGAFTGVNAAIDFKEDDFTASSVEATIDASTLSTHDNQRDGHLKSPDFLDVEHFPTITFKSTRMRCHRRAPAGLSDPRRRTKLVRSRHSPGRDESGRQQPSTIHSTAH